MKSFFVASTGQNVGKTTICLGLLSALKKQVGKVGFMKPVGQEHVAAHTGVRVDKDVVLFKEHFKLKDDYKHMSPVLFPAGFTRDYLDGRIDEKELKREIKMSYEAISTKNDIALVEGTGHVGVGSIINLNNAQVAALLNLPMIIVASGGLGSTFDQLMLNKTLCDEHGVKICGIILNRVLPDKREMIEHYMKKALSRWSIPLLGCIPFDPILSNPSMQDFEQLFQTTLMTGVDHRMRHFRHTRLVATSIETYQSLIVPNQLVITPADREDIIQATIAKHIDPIEPDFEGGLILTGDRPPRDYIIEQLKKADLPMLYTSSHSTGVMERILSHTNKILKEDKEKIHEAIELVETHVNCAGLANL